MANNFNLNIQLSSGSRNRYDVEVNSYFSKLYAGKISMETMIDIMKNLSNSPKDSRNNEIYKAMLLILFSECKFFPNYPVNELEKTAQLFGNLIKHDLLLYYGNSLHMALKCILDALKEGTASKMFTFGLTALEQFEEALPCYPKFLSALVSLPMLKEFSESYYAHCEFLLSIIPENMRHLLYIDPSTVMSLKQLAGIAAPPLDMSEAAIFSNTDINKMADNSETNKIIDKFNVEMKKNRGIQKFLDNVNMTTRDIMDGSIEQFSNNVNNSNLTVAEKVNELNRAKHSNTNRNNAFAHSNLRINQNYDNSLIGGTGIANDTPISSGMMSGSRFGRPINGELQPNIDSAMLNDTDNAIKYSQDLYPRVSNMVRQRGNQRNPLNRNDLMYQHEGMYQNLHRGTGGAAAGGNANMLYAMDASLNENELASILLNNRRIYNLTNLNISNLNNFNQLNQLNQLNEMTHESGKMNRNFEAQNFANLPRGTHKNDLTRGDHILGNRTNNLLINQNVNDNLGHFEGGQYDERRDGWRLDERRFDDRRFEAEMFSTPGNIERNTGVGSNRELEFKKDVEPFYGQMQLMLPPNLKAVKETYFGLGQIELLIDHTKAKDNLNIPRSGLIGEVFSVFNTLCALNMDEKVKILKELVQPEFYNWLAYYIVKSRATKETNLHSVYLTFIDKLSFPLFIDTVINVTYECINILFKYLHELREVSSFKTALKNLGAWLGYITIGRNRPLRSKILDLKALVFEAYEKGYLLCVLPLVCKILENVKYSKNLNVPNPWASTLLCILYDLHKVPGLKTNVIFEVEVLFNNLELSMDKFKNRTEYFKKRAKPINTNDFTQSKNAVSASDYTDINAYQDDYNNAGMLRNEQDTTELTSGLTSRRNDHTINPLTNAYLRNNNMGNMNVSNITGMNMSSNVGGGPAKWNRPRDAQMELPTDDVVLVNSFAPADISETNVHSVHFTDKIGHRWNKSEGGRGGVHDYRGAHNIDNYTNTYGGDMNQINNLSHSSHMNNTNISNDTKNARHGRHIDPANHVTNYSHANTNVNNMNNANSYDNSNNTGDVREYNNLNTVEMARQYVASSRFMQNLNDAVTISPAIALFHIQPSLRNVVPIAVDRAIREIISAILERSVAISCVTTREIIHKDFCLENDENLIRKAAHIMIASLAGSLALVTCKEPLQIALTQHLRQLLQPTSTKDCNDQVLIEQVVQILSADNLELGCNLIEQAVIEKAIKDINEALEPSFLTKKLIAENVKIEDSEYIASVKKKQTDFANTLQMKTVITADQLQIYKDFLTVAPLKKLHAAAKALSSIYTKSREPDDENRDSTGGNFDATSHNNANNGGIGVAHAMEMMKNENNKNYQNRSQKEHITTINSCVPVGTATGTGKGDGNIGGGFSSNRLNNANTYNNNVYHSHSGMHQMNVQSNVMNKSIPSSAGISKMNNTSNINDIGRLGGVNIKDATNISKYVEEHIMYSSIPVTIPQNGKLNNEKISQKLEIATTQLKDAVKDLITLPPIIFNINKEKNFYNISKLSLYILYSLSVDGNIFNLIKMIPEITDMTEKREEIALGYTNKIYKFLFEITPFTDKTQLNYRSNDPSGIYLEVFLCILEKMKRKFPFLKEHLSNILMSNSCFKLYEENLQTINKGINTSNGPEQKTELRTTEGINKNRLEKEDHQKDFAENNGMRSGIGNVNGRTHMHMNTNLNVHDGDMKQNNNTKANINIGLSDDSDKKQIEEFYKFNVNVISGFIRYHLINIEQYKQYLTKELDSGRCTNCVEFSILLLKNILIDFQIYRYSDFENIFAILEKVKDKNYIPNKNIYASNWPPMLVSDAIEKLISDCKEIEANKKSIFYSDLAKYSTYLTSNRFRYKLIDSDDEIDSEESQEHVDTSESQTEMVGIDARMKRAEEMESENFKEMKLTELNKNNKIMHMETDKNKIKITEEWEYKHLGEFCKGFNEDMGRQDGEQQKQANKEKKEDGDRTKHNLTKTQYDLKCSLYGTNELFNISANNENMQKKEKKKKLEKKGRKLTAKESKTYLKLLMSPKHLTTLTQIVDFCLNNNWSMIQKSKRTNFIKDKGVGGVRIVPKPQKVSKEHEKIISIVFNQWIKLCSMRSTENSIKAFVNFFQKLSDQGLLRIDHNTDKFFTVCIYKAVEKACASLNPFTKEDRDTFNVENGESVKKKKETTVGLMKTDATIDHAVEQNKEDTTSKSNDNSDQGGMEKKKQSEQIYKREEKTIEKNNTNEHDVQETKENNESCRDTTDDSDDYDCFSSGDLTFYSNFSNADTDEENKENEEGDGFLDIQDNKIETPHVNHSKKDNLISLSSALNELVNVRNSKEENAKLAQQIKVHVKEEKQADSDGTMLDNSNKKNEKREMIGEELFNRFEDKITENVVIEEKQEKGTEHSNVKTVAKTLEHIIGEAAQELDTELNTELDAGADTATEGGRSNNLEKQFLLSNTLDTLALDCLAKMIISMMKLVDAQQISPFILFQKAMNVFCRIVVYESRKNKESFNQRPYYRLFLSILVEVNKNEKGFESNYNKCILALGHYLSILNPLRTPMFVFAWLELISHRLFLPKILKSSKGWTIYNKLLIYLFEFLHDFLKNSYLTPSVQILYRGALRILLILLHDYPEFLCVYNFSFCNSVALNCVQLNNLILSAFPRHIKLLDPFYPNLKVDLLPEMKVAPAMLNNFTYILVDYNVKRDVDRYFLTRKLKYLKNIYTKLFIRNKMKALYLKTKYNIPLLNAVVLYVGISLPSQILMTEKTTNLHPTLEIICYLIHELDMEGRHYLISAIINHLRYPNSHTNNFSYLLLWIFHVSKPEIIKEQITGVMLERLIVHRPHPWGLLVTFIELIKNPIFNFWKSSFVRASPEVEKLFASIYSTCLQDRSDRSNINETNVVAGSVTSVTGVEGNKELKTSGGVNQLQMNADETDFSITNRNKGGVIDNKRDLIKDAILQRNVVMRDCNIRKKIDNINIQGHSN